MDDLAELLIHERVYPVGALEPEHIRHGIRRDGERTGIEIGVKSGLERFHEPDVSLMEVVGRLIRAPQLAEAVKGLCILRHADEHDAEPICGVGEHLFCYQRIIGDEQCAHTLRQLDAPSVFSAQEQQVIRPFLLAERGIEPMLFKRFYDRQFKVCQNDHSPRCL